MLALLRRQGGKLPDERVRLYQQYIDMLLDNNWEDVRSDGARTKAVVRFDRNLATGYLIELALWLQKHRPSGTAAWNLDHHFRARAGIHPGAVATALDRIRNEPAYENCLKIAVWHHPVDSAFEDRITDHGFLEQLAKAGFQLGLHGHIHKAQNRRYAYDRSPTGRQVELCCAGTFGAPTKEWTPGYPLQYQLLRFGGGALTVETRRREEINGAWKPDARWTSGPGMDPEPRYQISI